MILKTFLVCVAIAGGVYFVYLLTEIERCCDLLEENNQVVLDEEVVIKEVYNETKILHFGDLMLGRGVARTIERGLNPLQSIQPFIIEGGFDAVLANLEGPFTHSLECQIKPYSFRFEPETVTLLRDAGITGVSLANNHSSDCYERGASDSRDILLAAGIVPFGDDTHSLPEGSEWYAENLATTFFGFDTTLRLQTAEEMRVRIESDTRAGSRSVVHIHWGDEYEPYPNPAQKDLAKIFAEEGVSLIIGHHPHVMEPAEIIGETVVFYSLGNFVFDQDTLETQTGYAVEERVVADERDTVLREFVVHPYRIVSHAPELLFGTERTNVCNRVLSDIEVRDDNPCSFIVLSFDKKEIAF